MAESVGKEQAPMVSVSRIGLKVGMVTSLLVAIGLVAVLLAQDGMFSSNPGLPDHPDGLTTLALVLAILAFLIQIFVFVFQTNAANAAVRRSEELNIQTRGVLGKIEADSTATKQVLISQFNRLLDYVIDGRAQHAQHAEPADERISAPDTVSPQAAEPEEPLTVRALERALSNALRPAERPTFDLDAGVSPEDEAIVEYLREWAGEEEMRQSIGEMSHFPPYALALLTRYGTTEIEQRLSGKPVGLMNPKPLPAITAYLVDQGLLKMVDQVAFLTERGRKLARSLPIGKESVEVPVWFDKVTGPPAPE